MPPSADSALVYARDYHGAGISVLPVGKDKKPLISWKEYQSRPQREDELPELFKDSESNVGVIGGTVSDGLIILDHDNRELCTQLSKYSIYRFLLDNASIVETRRGFHAWAVSPVPVKSSKCSRFGVDVLAEGKYAVAPPSRIEREHHRDQLYMFGRERWLPLLRLDQEQFRELSELYDIQTLGEPVDGNGSTDATAPRLEAPGAFYGLGLGVLDRLKHPRPKGERSEIEGGIVYRAVGIGWTFPDVYELFRRHAADGSKFREKLVSGHAEAYLRLHYDSAQKKIVESMTARERAVNRALHALRSRNPFSGRSAATDRAVLTALLEISREAGRAEISPGVRRIAERAGFAFRATWEALGRLEELGLIHSRREESGALGFNVKRNHLSTWFERVLGRDIEAGESGRNIVAPASKGSHDAFRAGALGKDGPELLGFLRETIPLPFTRKAFPQHFSTMYLRRVLPILEEAGILVQVRAEAPKRRGRPEIFYQLTRPLFPSDLDRIAQAAGTAGTGERQRARHARERIAYKLRLAEK